MQSWRSPWLDGPRCAMTEHRDHRSEGDSTGAVEGGGAIALLAMVGGPSSAALLAALGLAVASGLGARAALRRLPRRRPR